MTLPKRFKKNGMRSSLLFVFSFQKALCQNPRSNGKAQYKGAVASVKSDFLPADGVFVSMRERKLRRQLARWYEIGPGSFVMNCHLSNLRNSAPWP